MRDVWLSARANSILDKANELGRLFTTPETNLLARVRYASLDEQTIIDGQRGTSGGSFVLQPQRCHE